MKKVHTGHRNKRTKQRCFNVLLLLGNMIYFILSIATLTHKCKRIRMRFGNFNGTVLSKNILLVQFFRRHFLLSSMFIILWNGYSKSVVETRLASFMRTGNLVSKREWGEIVCFSLLFAIAIAFIVTYICRRG